MFFSPSEERQLTDAIRMAEYRTTGEIRVYIEDICDRDHPVERAAELFALHGMHHTGDRNAVLIYLATVSRQFAFWGDTGIHDRVGFQFWETEKKLLRDYLQRDMPVEGLCAVIASIGEQLRDYFPADPLEDNRNELPDEIIYG